VYLFVLNAVKANKRVHNLVISPKLVSHK